MKRPDGGQGIDLHQDPGDQPLRTRPTFSTSATASGGRRPLRHLMARIVNYAAHASGPRSASLPRSVIPHPFKAVYLAWMYQVADQMEVQQDLLEYALFREAQRRRE